MELTISNGIISGFRDSNGGIKLLQSSVPFSPGSSGGGVFDEQGRLVGITTTVSTNAGSANAAAKKAQNLNFAVAAQSIPSAGISAAELAKQQRGVVSANAVAAPEVASERVRREEQDAVAGP